MATKPMNPKAPTASDGYVLSPSRYALIKKLAATAKPIRTNPARAA